MTRSTHEKAVHSARIPVLAVVLCLFGVARTVCGQSLEAQQVTKGGEVRSHWHGGPFFEYRRAVGPTPAGGTAEERLRTFWAFRPFYSQLRSPDVTTRDIVWPLVKPTTLFLLVTTFLSSMKVFQSVDILTSGGPARSTEVFVYLIYRYAMVDFRMDRAATSAVMFFVILLCITVATMKYSNNAVNYDA